MHVIAIWHLLWLCWTIIMSGHFGIKNQTWSDVETLSLYQLMQHFTPYLVSIFQGGFVYYHFIGEDIAAPVYMGCDISASQNAALEPSKNHTNLKLIASSKFGVHCLKQFSEKWSWHKMVSMISLAKTPILRAQEWSHDSHISLLSELQG